MAIDQATLFAAFRMPPEQAVAFLRSKGLQVSESWRDVWRECNARAFTVARTAGFDVLADIKDALIESITNGESYEAFAKKLTPTLQAKGWWGKAVDKATGEILKTYEGTSRAVELGSPRRLKLIYEQNVQTAFMAGRHREMLAASDTHPFWQYVAVLDKRTRPSHRALHGRVFRYDDAAWGVVYPPNGWRCRCRVKPLSAAGLKRLGVQVSTAAGYITTVDVPRRDGTFIKVQRVKLPDMQVPFQPDAGWDYNPAANFSQFKSTGTNG